jgi:membrane protein implicated in regulation of membrane protease activity
MLWFGVMGASEREETWAPLMLIAVAVSLWGVLLVRKTASRSGLATAAGLYAVGSIGYGALTGSASAMGVGVVATAGLCAGFPLLLRQTASLLDSPPQVGMEAFEGRKAIVASWNWEANRGTVRLDGSLWNATADVPVREGDEVLVVGYDRMELRIIPAPVAPW